MAATLPDGRLIQRAVDRLALIDQHKFTARIYLAVIGDQVYCADETVLFVHGESYAPNNPSFAAQVDNISYRDPDSSIRVIKGSDSPHAEALRSSSGSLARGLTGLLKDLTGECADNAFALLDTLLTQSRLKLLRIHTYNFITTADIDSEVHVPLFEDVLRVMAGDTPQIPSSPNKIPYRPFIIFIYYGH